MLLLQVREMNFIQNNVTFNNDKQNVYIVKELPPLNQWEATLKILQNAFETYMNML